MRQSSTDLLMHLELLIKLCFSSDARVIVSAQGRQSCAALLSQRRICSTNLKQLTIQAVLPRTFA